MRCVRSCASRSSSISGTPTACWSSRATGFLTKGEHSAGVACQHGGTAGTVENCQSGVLLGYASVLGPVRLDRDPYLPAAWTQDRERCRQAAAGLPAAGPRLRRLASPPHGALGTACRAMTGACGGGGRPDRRPLCSRSRARYMSGYAGSSSRSKRSWRACRWRAGAGSVLEMERQAPAGMPGAGCPWPIPWTPPGAGGIRRSPTPTILNAVRPSRGQSP